MEGHSLFSALYINEILFYILKPYYPDEALFEAYLLTLNNLTLTKERLVIESLLRRFEWVLLRSCGYSFSFTHEARTDLNITAELYYQFIAGEGFIVSSTGIPGSHILALAEDNLERIDYLRSAKFIMRKAIDHLLGGREIKARELYF